MINQQEKMRVQNTLREFGLGKTAANTYIQCLILGSSSIQEIAKNMNINRVTVHSAVEQLIGKGLLKESRKGKRRLIFAEGPEALERIRKKKMDKLSQMEGQVQYLMQTLSKINIAGGPQPTVSFYNGVDGLKKMLDESLEANGEILVFSYVEMLAEAVGREYLEAYFKKRSSMGIKTRLIFPPCAFAGRVMEQAVKYDINVRILPKNYEWSAGFFLWNEKVAWLSYTEGKRSVTVIQNKDIAEFVRNVIFEIAWNVVS